MKIANVYHSIDLDGWVSASIVKLWFKTNYPNATEFPYAKNSLIEESKTEQKILNQIDFIGYDHKYKHSNVPDLSNYDKVIMCDVSFPKKYMIELQSKGENFIWIDHHISAINEMDISINGLQNTQFSACELTWKYFFPNEHMPEFVRMIGVYDSFRHIGTNEQQKIIEYQYGARTLIENYNDAYNFLKNRINFHLECEDGIFKIGRNVHKFLCLEAKKLYKNAMQTTFYVNETPKKFVCINKEKFNPIDFGIDVHSDGYDGTASYFKTKDGSWYFSLYNDNKKTDCSVIAKQYGGGGHRGASGFSILNINDISMVHKNN